MAKLTLPEAKRVGPPEVAPVTIGSVRYEAIHWGRDRGLGQNGGYVAAISVATGAELWTSKVYTIDYKPKLETDVQDIFIKSLAASRDGRTLMVVDEDDRHYEVDLATHAAHPTP